MTGPYTHRTIGESADEKLLERAEELPAKSLTAIQLHAIDEARAYFGTCFSLGIIRRRRLQRILNPLAIERDEEGMPARLIL